MTPDEKRRELLRNFDRAEQALREPAPPERRAPGSRSYGAGRGPHPGGLYRDQRKRQGQDGEAVDRLFLKIDYQPRHKAVVKQS